MSQTEPHSGDAPNPDDSDLPLGGNRPANNAVRATAGSLPTKSYLGDSEAADFLGLDDELEGGTSRATGAFELLSEAPFGGQASEQTEPLALAGPTEDVYDEVPEGQSTDAGEYALDSEVEDAFAFAVEDGVDEYESESQAEPSSEFEDDAEVEPEVDPQDDRENYREDDRAQASGSSWSEQEAEAGLHGAWREPETSSAGAGRLVGLAAGAVFIGLIGFAGVKFLGASRQADAERSEPLAANPAPANEAGFELAAPLLDDASEDLELAQTVAGEDTQTDENGDAFSAGLDLDGEAAREAYDDLRGNEPPVWFDPNLDGGSEPTETGWTPEAEAVTQAESPDADNPDDPAGAALAGAQTELEGESTGEAPLELARSEGESDPLAAPLELLGSGPTGDQEGGLETLPVTTPEGDLLAQAAPPADAQPQQGTASIVAPVSDPLAGAQGAPGPQLGLADTSSQVASANTDALGPRPVDGALPVDTAGSTGSGQGQSRQTRTSTLKVEDVLLAPTMDASSLRQANAQDLSGVWKETSVPMQGIDSKNRVLTPNVGRVRVVLKSKDIFEGTLYAVGKGNVWLDSELGRIAVTSTRIASVQKLDTKEGAPVLGSTGSQDLAGLTRVRVKTPGGTFYGKIISRDADRTTVITDDGARLTLESKNVEFLAEAPQITVRGKVDEKAEAKSENKPNKP